MVAIAGLGRLFDIAIGWTPVNMADAQTGKRILMSNAAGATVVVIKGVGTAGDDQSYDLQQADAATGGNVKDLDKIATYYLKDELALDGDEAWSKLTQTEASEITEAGGVGTSAEHEQIIAIEVDAADMDMANGYKYLSLNAGGEGNNSQLGCCIVILHGLAYAAAPASLPATQ